MDLDTVIGVPYSAEWYEFWEEFPGEYWQETETDSPTREEINGM